MCASKFESCSNCLSKSRNLIARANIIVYILYTVVYVTMESWRGGGGGGQLLCVALSAISSSKVPEFHATEMLFLGGIAC